MPSDIVNKLTALVSESRSEHCDYVKYGDNCGKCHHCLAWALDENWAEQFQAPAMLEALKPFARAAEALAGGARYPEKYRITITDEDGKLMQLTGADFEAALAALEYVEAE